MLRHVQLHSRSHGAKGHWRNNLKPFPRWLREIRGKWKTACSFHLNLLAGTSPVRLPSSRPALYASELDLSTISYRFLVLGGEYYEIARKPSLLLLPSPYPWRISWYLRIVSLNHAHLLFSISHSDGIYFFLLFCLQVHGKTLTVKSFTDADVDNVNKATICRDARERKKRIHLHACLISCAFMGQADTVC